MRTTWGENAAPVPILSRKHVLFGPTKRIVGRLTRGECIFHRAFTPGEKISVCRGGNGQKKYLGRYATRNKGINDVWVAYFSRYVHVPLLENIIDILIKFRFGRHTGEIIIIINCTYLF